MTEKGTGLSEPDRRPQPTPDPQQLLHLAAADDDAFRKALLGHLAKPNPESRALFWHDTLLRRTRKAVSSLILDAEANDRRHNPENVRAWWRGVRLAARRERDAIRKLPPPGAGPRRRALERLGHEFPTELEQLTAASRRSGRPKNARRVLLEDLAALHPERMIRLLQQERGSGPYEPQPGVNTRRVSGNVRRWRRWRKTRRAGTGETAQPTEL